MYRRSPLLASAAVLTLLAACSSESNPVATPPPVVARINVTAPSSAIPVGGTTAVTATVTADNGSLVVDRAVDWVSSNLNIATVTATGKLTATVQGVGPGTVIISAKLDGKFGSVSLISSHPQPPPPRQGFLWSEADGFTIIAPLPGATASFPVGINSAGTVVGHGNGREPRSFIWRRSRGTPLDLGLLPGSTACYAKAINDAEQVVGTCYFQQSTSRAFRWTAAAGMTEVGVPAGAVGSTATSINSAGEIGGASLVSSGSTFVAKPGRWNSAGVFESLKLPGLTTYGVVTGIDDAGNAVGWASDGSDYYSPVAAVLWKRGSSTETVIEACVQFGCATFPSAMSRNGRVAGFRNSMAFIWTEAAGFTDYPSLSGANFSQATGINDSGQAAVNEYFNVRVQPWIISPTGVRRALVGPPGTTSANATAINNAGQVVGYAG